MTSRTEDTSAPRFEDWSARRWRVFVSSTSRGLDGFRNAARDVIRDFRYAGMQCFEPVMMEDFGARDGEARQVCAEAVGGCDVLVGIIGVRYGSYPPDDPACTSYTELEFQTAVKHELSRLMYLLEPALAGVLEYDESQTEDRVDRQRIFRDQVSNALVCEIDVTAVEAFRQQLADALTRWIDKDSFKKALVDHSTDFSQACGRLLDLGARTGGATLVFGEPGTGKSTLFRALLNDVPLQRSYARLAGPLTVRLAGGKGAVEQARTEMLAILHSIAGQQAWVPGAGDAGLASLLPVLGSEPVLIALLLETGDEVVDPQTLSLLSGLFTWDPLRAVVLAETNNHSVKDHLADELRWPAEAVVTVRDYENIDDALEQMRRDAPSVPQWPEAAKTLAEALGLRPIALRDVATSIGTAAAGSAKRAAALIRGQLDAIAHEHSPADRYGALIRNHLDHLSPEARELLALMTVLHPKPALIPDEMALAFDLSLDLDEAVRLATAEDDEDDEEEDEEEDEARHRDRADRLVAELVGRGLLEREPRLRPAKPKPDSTVGNRPELLTLHSTKRRVIQDRLLLTPDRRAEGHARAEAFYRARIGEAVSGSFDSRFRMEDEDWWDNVQEWIYHLGHIEPGQASVGYATLYLDAFWWWDLYVSSGFCGRLLAYGARPLVNAVSPDMPAVVKLLTQFHRTYPVEYEAIRARVLAEIAGDDPAFNEALRTIIRRGADLVPILQKLCGKLGITELDALFTDSTPAPDVNDADPVPPSPASGPAAADGNKRQHDHLLGLICLFLAEGHRYRAEAEPGGTALGTAQRCYQRAESHFRAEGDSWDVAWTHYLLGEVISLRGGDPMALWDQATGEANTESDTELAANIERALADHLRSRGDPEGALTHYGRAVFYAMAFQITSNVAAGADKYTQAFYREIRLQSAKMLVEPLLRDQGSPLKDRLAEAQQRLETMLGSWGGSWEPDHDALDRALRSASRNALGSAVDTIADAAFPPGPGDAVLQFPKTEYHEKVRDRIERTRTRPWVKTLGRLKHWDNARKRDSARRPMPPPRGN
jgi:hypothetical protein